MTIEFNCPQCDKLLRTPDDKAGAQAKCPGCGEPIVVPSPGGDTDFSAQPPPPPPIPAAGSTDDENPYAFESAPSPTSPAAKSDAQKPCPMCGMSIKAAAIKCRYCGETFGTGPTVSAGTRTLDPGDIMSAGFNITRNNFGQVIGGSFVALLLMMLGSFPLFVLLVMVETGAIPEEMFFILYFPMLILSQVISVYFMLGYCIFLLNIVRGQHATLSDLFKGGPYYLRGLGNMLLFMLAVMVGYVLCIVPGIIVITMLWPFMFILIDENPRGMDCLTRAKEMTEGHKLMFFVNMLIIGFLGQLGMLACYVGLFLTGPWMYVCYTVCYCRIAGQPTVEERST